MYDIIKNVITSGRYELMDMLAKIDTIWLQGDITDDQRAELVTLAQEHADPENSYAPLQRQITALFENLAELAAAVKANTDAITVLQGGEVIPPEVDEWPPYKQPTGAHDAYHNGDKVTFNGKRYICTAPDGVAVVWGPDTMPGYWAEAEE